MLHPPHHHHCRLLRLCLIFLIAAVVVVHAQIGVNTTDVLVNVTSSKCQTDNNGRQLNPMAACHQLAPTHQSSSVLAQSVRHHRDTLPRAGTHASIKDLVKDRRCMLKGGSCYQTPECYALGGRTDERTKSLCGGPVSRQCCFLAGKGDENRHHVGPRRQE